MIVNVRSVLTNKQITEDASMGTSSLQYIDVYGPDSLEDFVSIEAKYKIDNAKKCIAIREEEGLQHQCISFCLSLQDALILGKHLQALAEIKQ